MLFVVSFSLIIWTLEIKILQIVSLSKQIFIESSIFHDNISRQECWDGK